MVESISRAATGRSAAPIPRRRLGLMALLAGVAMLSFAPPAWAGQASAGQLFFLPCSTCHPVTLIPGTDTPTRPLPNGTTGHKIVLESHDKLGDGDAACLVCHGAPDKDPSRLKVADGGSIDIEGDVSLVCQTCHSARYNDWKAGTHGRNQPSCTAAGCHDPHTPGYIYAEPLEPFLGTGFQFKVLPVRQPFTPLAPPAPPPPTMTPPWFVTGSLVGLLLAGGLVGFLLVERPKR